MSKFTVSVYAEQDCTPVRGNALASGDSAEDKRCEDEILARLESGDIWAWASVTVRVEYNDTSGEMYSEAYLGCCSYAAEAEFRADAYFTDMVDECKSILIADARALIAAIENETQSK